MSNVTWCRRRWSWCGPLVWGDPGTSCCRLTSPATTTAAAATTHELHRIAYYVSISLTTFFDDGSKKLKLLEICLRVLALKNGCFETLVTSISNRSQHYIRQRRLSGRESQGFSQPPTFNNVDYSSLGKLKSGGIGSSTTTTTATAATSSNCGFNSGFGNVPMGKLPHCKKSRRCCCCCCCSFLLLLLLLLFLL